MSTDEERRALHEQNRRSWNAVTAAHNSHKLDQAGFLRRGGSTLYPEELELLGEVAGRRLLHLQCNCGQDSLSLASLGADVLGVDISDAAIQTAQELAQASGLPARFERADVLDWLDAAVAEGRRFDRVFSSYGTIPWLADLARWARGVWPVTYNFKTNSVMSPIVVLDVVGGLPHPLPLSTRERGARQCCSTCPL